MKLSWLLLPFTATAHYLKGVSFYGLETEWRDFVCSWKNPPSFYLAQLQTLNFNLLRLPFSFQYVQEKNFQKMDEIVGYAYWYNMSVVLDMHRIWSSHQGSGPEEGITMTEFIQNGWFPVLDRYLNFPNVVMHNIYNEYQGTDVAYLKSYSLQVMDAVEARYGPRYQHAITGYKWGGTLEGFDIGNVTYKDRIWYSVHKYAFSGTADEADWNTSFPTNLTQFIVGEMGFKMTDHDIEWANRFIDFLIKRDIRHTAFWTIAHSSDTDGLWYDDCQNFDWSKYQIFNRLYPPQ
jgi:hypothetical protein